MIMFLILAVLLSWLSASATLAWAIYASNDSEQMLRFMIRDTYAMVVVGVLLYMWVPNAAPLMLILIIRCMMLASTDWNLVCDRYKDIKQSF